MIPSFSKFIYLDTSAISLIVKDQDLVNSFRNYLFESDLTLAICSSHFLELHDMNRRHEELKGLLLSIPSALIKEHFVIEEEEFSGFPDPVNVNLLTSPLILLFSEQKLHLLDDALSGNNVKLGRLKQLNDAGLLNSEFYKRRDNFPRSKNGKFEIHQALEFAFMVIVEKLVKVKPILLKLFREQGKDISYFNSLKSNLIIPYYVFFKYYVGKREPLERSDFGDLFHLYAMPYCTKVITEKDSLGTLKTVKKHTNLLNSVDLMKTGDFIRFLKSF